MESLFGFLLRASAGITLLYIIYWIFLRNETFYRANRWFLLFALISAVLLPLFPVHYSVLIEPEKNTTIFQALNDTFKNIQPIQTEVSETTENFGWRNIILTIYITGTTIFLIRLLTQTIILIHLMIKYRIKSLNGICIVENEKYGLPFSFFNVVFINPKFHTQANLPEILAHEKVHIREFHWFDLLFIELLTVIFWFNPFIWFFEHAIKQNHEYLADSGVLANGHSVTRYQALLINQLMGMQIIGITNNLNFALNTNRFKMMTKKKTSRWLGIKFVWALPAIALLLFAFAEPAYKVKKAETENSVSLIQKGEKEQVINGKVVNETTKKPLPGASVIIKGTSIGTVTDSEGKFTLTDPNPKVDEKTGRLSSELVISYVGFESHVAMVEASGTALENGSSILSSILYTFKLKEGVIYIDPLSFKKVELNSPESANDKNVPPPPPPPAKVEKAKQPSSSKDEKIPPPPPPPVPNKVDSEDAVFIVVEELPEYPGGHSELAKYVLENQKKLAKEKNCKGKVKVGFTVNAKGKVTNIKILHEGHEYTVGETKYRKTLVINPKAEEAAVAIVAGMKDWKPGSQRGTKVPVNYILPVEF